MYQVGPSGALQNPVGKQQSGNQTSTAQPDRFGLLGLLSVIRMTDPDLTTLALGTDLTTLGLHLNSSDNVYKTFAHPWADNPLRPEPDFSVSASSLNHKVAPYQSLMWKLLTTYHPSCHLVLLKFESMKKSLQASSRKKQSRCIARHLLFCIET